MRAEGMAFRLLKFHEIREEMTIARARYRKRNGVNKPDRSSRRSTFLSGDQPVQVLREGMKWLSCCRSAGISEPFRQKRPKVEQVET